MEMNQGKAGRQPALKPSGRVLTPTQKAYLRLQPANWDHVNLKDSCFLCQAGAGKVLFSGRPHDWSAKRLIDLFRAEAELAPTRGAGLPLYSEEIAPELFSEDWQQRSTTLASRFQTTHTSSFKFLAFRFTEKHKEPVGFVSFNWATTVPTELSLVGKDAVAIPAISLQLNLGGFWMRPAHRKLGWTNALLGVYAEVQTSELDAVAYRLGAWPPLHGRKHKVVLQYKADYWSKAGKRSGAKLLAALRKNAKEWASQNPAFSLKISVYRGP